MAEYQLTIQGYEEAKNSIKENLYGIGKSFVMIGWQTKDSRKNTMRCSRTT